MREDAYEQTGWALASALCAYFFAVNAYADANKVVIGDIDDMSGLYADVIGRKRRRGDQDGDRGFRRLGARASRSKC